MLPSRSWMTSQSACTRCGASTSRSMQMWLRFAGRATLLPSRWAKAQRAFCRTPFHPYDSPTELPTLCARSLRNLCLQQLPDDP